MDWWTFAFSLVAAATGVYAAWRLWWETPTKSMEIQFSHDGKALTTTFSVIGTLVAFRPEIDVICGGSFTTDPLPTIMRADLPPIVITVPIRDEQLLAFATASIWWVSGNNRTRKTQGLRYDYSGRLHRWHSRKLRWVELDPMTGRTARRKSKSA